MTTLAEFAFVSAPAGPVRTGLRPAARPHDTAQPRRTRKSAAAVRVA